LRPVGATLVVARNNNIVAIANSPHPPQKTEHLLTNIAAISLNNETTGQIHADTLTNAAATSLNSETTEQIIKTPPLNNETTEQTHADTLTNTAATSLNNETAEQHIEKTFQNMTIISLIIKITPQNHTIISKNKKTSKKPCTTAKCNF
jgi:hypothetical protein